MIRSANPFRKKSDKDTVVNLTGILREEDVGGDENRGSRSRDYFTQHQHVLFKKDTVLTRTLKYNIQIQDTNFLLSLNSLLFTISFHITSMCDALHY